jgi:hypothetical protein
MPQTPQVEFARRELQRAGFLDGGYGGDLGKAVLGMIERFAGERHSGASARAVADMFGRLARFEPLSPLTGEAAEWREVGPGVFQNLRCPRIFGDGLVAVDGLTGERVRFPYVPASDVQPPQPAGTGD